MVELKIQEGKTGFQTPQEPQDEWTTRLYETHGLGGTPSLEDIEPIATELLDNPLTFLSAAELVLGRRVDAKEREVVEIVTALGLSGAERFGLLLMQKAVEQMRREKK